MKNLNKCDFIIQIDGQDYLCVVKKFKTMNFIKIRINNELKITIHTSPKIPLQFIKNFVESQEWLIKKRIDDINSRKFFNPNNNVISLFGKEHNLIVKNHTGNDKYIIGYKIITLYLKDESNKLKLIKRLLKNESKKYFETRVKELASLYSFVVDQVKVKWMVGCWANCRASKKLLTFSTALITFPKEIIDYVIVHELCHLKISNHSSDFWHLVSQFYPNYKYARNFLKKF